MQIVAELLLFVLFCSFDVVNSAFVHLSASDTSFDAAKAGVRAAQPVFQLSTDAWRAGCLSVTPATTVVRLSTTVTV